jgi:drug/metabolite transporter (DMT)-like permease
LQWTGVLVAVGFLLYHASPVTSPLTFPYWGRRDVGWIQWLPVLAAIVVGVWCAVAGAARQRGDSA